jgi:hexosaminidase
MSWRGTQGGIKAAALGNDTVMTPDGPLYFDAYQGDRNQEPLAIGGLSTPQMVYNYDPLAQIPRNEQRYILGVQANIWTEWIGSVQHLFYMALPRELALSEIAWTAPQNKNWNSFEQRMGPQYLWLQQQRFNFRIPNPAFSIAGGALQLDNVVPGVQTISAHIDASSVSVTLSDPVPNAALVYTTDGTDPKRSSQRYTKALQLSLEPGQRVTISAAAVLPNGRMSTITKLILERER